MTSIKRCARIAGFSSKELIIGVELSDTHKRLLAGYELNGRLGRIMITKTIVADMRRYLELGALARAADLFVGLRLFLRSGQLDHPLFSLRRLDARGHDPHGGAAPRF
jgi:hypothetical protein